jgi:hypothetical protein
MLDEASDNGLGVNVDAATGVVNDLHKKLLPAAT